MLTTSDHRPLGITAPTAVGLKATALSSSLRFNNNNTTTTNTNSTINKFASASASARVDRWSPERSGHYSIFDSVAEQIQNQNEALLQGVANSINVYDFSINNKQTSPNTNNKDSSGFPNSTCNAVMGGGHGGGERGGGGGGGGGGGDVNTSINSHTNEMRSEREYITTTDRADAVAAALSQSQRRGNGMVMIRRSTSFTTSTGISRQRTTQQQQQQQYAPLSSSGAQHLTTMAPSPNSMSHTQQSSRGERGGSGRYASPISDEEEEEKSSKRKAVQKQRVGRTASARSSSSRGSSGATAHKDGTAQNLSGRSRKNNQIRKLKVPTTTASGGALLLETSSSDSSTFVSASRRSSHSPLSASDSSSTTDRGDDQGFKNKAESKRMNTNDRTVDNENAFSTAADHFQANRPPPPPPAGYSHLSPRHQRVRERMAAQDAERQRKAEQELERTRAKMQIVEAKKHMTDNARSAVVAQVWWTVFTVANAAARIHEIVMRKKALLFLAFRLLPRVRIKVRRMRCEKEIESRRPEIESNFGNGKQPLNRPTLEVLKSDEVLKLFPNALLEELLPKMEPRFYYRGDIIYYQGASGSEAFVLSEGEVVYRTARQGYPNGEKDREKGASSAVAALFSGVEGAKQSHDNIVDEHLPLRALPQATKVSSKPSVVVSSSSLLSSPSLSAVRQQGIGFNNTVVVPNTNTSQLSRVGSSESLLHASTGTLQRKPSAIQFILDTDASERRDPHNHTHTGSHYRSSHHASGKPNATAAAAAVTSSTPPSTQSFSQNDNGIFARRHSEGAESIASSTSEQQQQEGPPKGSVGATPTQHPLRSGSSAAVEDDLSSPKYIGAGQVFGANGMISGEKRSATYRAATDVVVWAIRREDFETAIANSNAKQVLQRALGVVRASHCANIQKLHNKAFTPDGLQKFEIFTRVERPLLKSLGRLVVAQDSLDLATKHSNNETKTEELSSSTASLSHSKTSKTDAHFALQRNDKADAAPPASSKKILPEAVLFQPGEALITSFSRPESSFLVLAGAVSVEIDVPTRLFLPDHVHGNSDPFLVKLAPSQPPSGRLPTQVVSSSSSAPTEINNKFSNLGTSSASVSAVKRSVTESGGNDDTGSSYFGGGCANALFFALRHFVDAVHSTRRTNIIHQYDAVANAVEEGHRKVLAMIAAMSSVPHHQGQGAPHAPRGGVASAEGSSSSSGVPQLSESRNSSSTRSHDNSKTNKQQQAAGGGLAVPSSPASVHTSASPHASLLPLPLPRECEPLPSHITIVVPNIPAPLLVGMSNMVMGNQHGPVRVVATSACDAMRFPRNVILEEFNKDFSSFPSMQHYVRRRRLSYFSYWFVRATPLPRSEPIKLVPRRDAYRELMSKIHHAAHPSHHNRRGGDGDHQRGGSPTRSTRPPPHSPSPLGSPSSPPKGKANMPLVSEGRGVGATGSVGFNNAARHSSIFKAMPSVFTPLSADSSFTLGSNVGPKRRGPSGCTGTATQSSASSPLPFSPFLSSLFTPFPPADPFPSGVDEFFIDSLSNVHHHTNNGDNGANGNNNNNGNNDLNAADEAIVVLRGVFGQPLGTTISSRASADDFVGAQPFLWPPLQQVFYGNYSGCGAKVNAPMTVLRVRRKDIHQAITVHLDAENRKVFLDFIAECAKYENAGVVPPLVAFVSPTHRPNSSSVLHHVKKKNAAKESEKRGSKRSLQQAHRSLVGSRNISFSSATATVNAKSSPATTPKAKNSAKSSEPFRGAYPSTDNDYACEETNSNATYQTDNDDNEEDTATSLGGDEINRDVRATSAGNGGSHHGDSASESLSVSPSASVSVMDVGAASSTFGGGSRVAGGGGGREKKAGSHKRSDAQNSVVGAEGDSGNVGESVQQRVQKESGGKRDSGQRLFYGPNGRVFDPTLQLKGSDWDRRYRSWPQQPSQQQQQSTTAPSSFWGAAVSVGATANTDEQTNKPDSNTDTAEEAAAKWAKRRSTVSPPKICGLVGDSSGALSSQQQELSQHFVSSAMGTLTTPTKDTSHALVSEESKARAVAVIADTTPAGAKSNLGMWTPRRYVSYAAEQQQAKQNQKRQSSSNSSSSPHRGVLIGDFVLKSGLSTTSALLGGRLGGDGVMSYDALSDLLRDSIPTSSPYNVNNMAAAQRKAMHESKAPVYDVADVRDAAPPNRPETRLTIDEAAKVMAARRKQRELERKAKREEKIAMRRAERNSEYLMLKSQYGEEKATAILRQRKKHLQRLKKRASFSYTRSSSAAESSDGAFSSTDEEDVTTSDDENEDNRKINKNSRSIKSAFSSSGERRRRILSLRPTGAAAAKDGEQPSGDASERKGNAEDLFDLEMNESPDRKNRSESGHFGEKKRLVSSAKKRAKNREKLERIVADPSFVPKGQLAAAAAKAILLRGPNSTDTAQQENFSNGTAVVVDMSTGTADPRVIAQKQKSTVTAFPAIKPSHQGDLGVGQSGIAMKVDPFGADKASTSSNKPLPLLFNSPASHSVLSEAFCKTSPSALPFRKSGAPTRRLGEEERRKDHYATATTPRSTHVVDSVDAMSTSSLPRGSLLSSYSGAHHSPSSTRPSEGRGNKEVGGLLVSPRRVFEASSFPASPSSVSASLSFSRVPPQPPSNSPARLWGVPAPPTVLSPFSPPNSEKSGHSPRAAPHPIGVSTTTVVAVPLRPPNQTHSSPASGLTPNTAMLMGSVSLPQSSHSVGQQTILYRNPPLPPTMPLQPSPASPRRSFSPPFSSYSARTWSSNGNNPRHQQPQQRPLLLSSAVESYTAVVGVGSMPSTVITSPPAGGSGPKPHAPNTFLRFGLGNTAR